MDTTPEGRFEALRAGVVLTRRRIAGACVLCVSGRLWVTEAGFAVDHMLCAGDHCVVCGPGLVVIEALRDAVLMQSDGIAGRTAIGPAKKSPAGPRGRR
jgi:hypothetical protein